MTTSSDGRLTATADPATGSVLLSTNFATTGYNTVTIQRADGTIVRGADATLALRGVLIKGVDHEAPLGVAVVYIATATNGVSIMTSTTATATVSGQSDVTWLKSLRTPSLSVQLEVASPADYVSDLPMSVLYPLGGAYPTVSVGVRQAKTGTIAVNVSSRAQLDALEALLGSDGPLLLQYAANSEEPARYVVCGSVTVAWDVPVATVKERTVSFPIITVARPSTAGSRVSAPGHTYADSKVTWPLYSNRTGTYGSR